LTGTRGCWYASLEKGVAIDSENLAIGTKNFVINSKNVTIHSKTLALHTKNLTVNNIDVAINECNLWKRFTCQNINPLTKIRTVTFADDSLNSPRPYMSLHSPRPYVTFLEIG
jgi:hypothetical protein